MRKLKVGDWVVVSGSDLGQIVLIQEAEDQQEQCIVKWEGQLFLYPAASLNCLIAVDTLVPKDYALTLLAGCSAQVTALSHQLPPGAASELSTRALKKSFVIHRVERHLSGELYCHGVQADNVRAIYWLIELTLKTTQPVFA